MKLLVVIAVGLRPKDLQRAPRLAAVAETGFAAPLRTVFPAVTCTVQASWLTGAPPRDHGIVANGWYFRDLAQVWLWRQSNHLVQGEKVYETARQRDPAFTCAKMFWWWNMYAAVDWSVTPRPEYHADGLKKPGVYSSPAGLGPQLQERLGAFPLFQFWGPGAGIASSRWIADATLAVIEEHDPTLALAYLPHLDYDHQRHGPDDPRSQAAVAALDAEAGRLVEAARARGAHVIVLSEYGIEDATTPVFVNRILHDAGLLAVQETSHGQLLDAGASRAFAVADHQAAHVYVRDPADLEAVRGLLQRTTGIARVLDRGAQHEQGIDHPRSGQLVCVAEPGCWFAYHYWLDETRRPDFATTVDIHRKPGYDPTELFLDPKIRLPKLKIAGILLKKMLGFRYLMDVIGTDPGLVRGTHGRLYDSPEAGPVYLCSSPDGAADQVDALSVRDRILRLVAPGSSPPPVRPIIAMMSTKRPVFCALAAAASLFSGAPAAAAPQAPSKPSATSKPADKASQFARFVPVGDDEGRFEVAITTYKNADGAEVSLVAAVHVADAAHYAALQMDFERYDALLYELVADPDTRPDPKSAKKRSSGLIGLIQTGLKNALGLEFQLHAIDYTPANFVHADLTPEGFKEKMEESGETFLQLFLRLMSKEAKRQRELREKTDGGGETEESERSERMQAFDLVSAFQRREGRHLLRLNFAKQLQSVEMLAAGAGEKGSVLLEGRNARALEVLQGQLAKGHKKLGIYYGAAHMPGIETTMLEELGFEKVAQRWLVAWDITKRKDPRPGKGK